MVLGGVDGMAGSLLVEFCTGVSGGLIEVAGGGVVGWKNRSRHFCLLSLLAIVRCVPGPAGFGVATAIGL